MISKNSKTIFDAFRLTNDEWYELERKFDSLCKFEAWQLRRKNSQNNMTDTDIDDIIQDLRIAVIRAGVYYKRQVYIENCLKAAARHVNDPFVRIVITELQGLWDERTKHGANKQRFGSFQEKVLNCIVQNCVPKSKRPDPHTCLKIDKKFSTYCKNITWNQQKSLGRKITRERSIRSGMTSLSDYDYLASDRD